jgi:hypothetical protein
LEGVDLQSGVVGDGSEAGDVDERIALQPGVLLQGVTGLVDIGDMGGPGSQFDGVAGRVGHDGHDLPGLVGVGGGEHQGERSRPRRRGPAAVAGARHLDALIEV